MSSILTVDESPGKMYALAAVVMALAIVALILRIYSRHLAKACFKLDDFLITLATLLTLALGICMISGR